MLYDKLKAKDKVLILELFEGQKTIKQTQETVNDLKDRVFELVKANKSITRGKDTVSYVPQADDKQFFNEEKFAQEHPRLYGQYIETKDGAKEHLRVVVK